MTAQKLMSLATATPIGLPTDGDLAHLVKRAAWWQVEELRTTNDREQALRLIALSAPTDRAAILALIDELQEPWAADGAARLRATWSGVSTDDPDGRVVAKLRQAFDLASAGVITGIILFFETDDEDVKRWCAGAYGFERMIAQLELAKTQIAITKLSDEGKFGTDE